MWSTTQHIFFFSRAKKSRDGADVACYFAKYLISGVCWEGSMNETRRMAHDPW